MTPEPPFANPILKAITVSLNAEAGQQYAAARQELVLNALAAALIALNDSSSLAWTVQAVPGGQPLLYDLTPLLEHPVSAKEAWEMTYALRNQPQVTAAEPTFVTPQGPPDPSTTAPDSSASAAAIDEHDDPSKAPF